MVPGSNLTVAPFYGLFGRRKSSSKTKRKTKLSSGARYSGDHECIFHCFRWLHQTLIIGQSIRDILERFHPLANALHVYRGQATQLGVQAYRAHDHQEDLLEKCPSLSERWEAQKHAKCVPDVMRIDTTHHTLLECTLT